MRSSARASSANEPARSSWDAERSRADSFGESGERACLGLACQSKGKPSGSKNLDFENPTAEDFFSKWYPQVDCVRYHIATPMKAIDVTSAHVAMEYQNFNHVLSVRVTMNMGTP